MRDVRRWRVGLKTRQLQLYIRDQLCLTPHELLDKPVPALSCLLLQYCFTLRLFLLMMSAERSVSVIFHGIAKL